MYKMAKAAWIAALRSGEYKQAQCTLCKLNFDDDGNTVVEGFCCLGVLCEVAIADGVELTTSDTHMERSYNGNNGHLPEAVCTWAGLKDANPILIPQIAEHDGPVCESCGIYHGQGNILQQGLTAVSANDDAKLSFDQIADLVQAFL